MSAKKSAAAGVNATWAAQPTSGDWNTAANWSPASVPTGTATFDATSNPEVNFVPGSTATVQQIVFTAQAPAYTVNFAPITANEPPTLIISGTGCSNAGKKLQQFFIEGSAQAYTEAQLQFTSSASAGNSNISYSVGPASANAHGGGAIDFNNSSTAGSADFTIYTGSDPTGTGLPGGEVGFSDTSNAGTATFTIFGTTGSYGDTFGNAAFHDSSSAANATFTNIGGTVAGGDGGNTQFYDTSTAASANFTNYGGSTDEANGGDVAFDGTANAGKATFQNYASSASGGNGGVVSFNNNGPPMSVNQGSSAANASIYNFGAVGPGQGGGHTSFSAVYGSPTAANALILNFGSAVASESSSAAGHTTFSIQTPQTAPNLYVSTAGESAIWNYPGLVSGAPGGLTTFAVYGAKNSKPVGPNGPTAGSATIINVGGFTSGAEGGATRFEYWSNAGNATIIALGGMLGGNGGTISFSDNASGGSSTIGLLGDNATLDISYSLASTLTMQNLEVIGGTINTNVGSGGICLAISNQLFINSSSVLSFNFYDKGVLAGKAYTILTAPNLSSYLLSQFSGNKIGTNAPQFSISGDSLQVTFGGSSARATKSTAAKGKVRAAPKGKAKPASKPVKRKPAKRKPAKPKKRPR
jgi:hypothetical protein